MLSPEQCGNGRLNLDLVDSTTQAPRLTVGTIIQSISCSNIALWSFFAVLFGACLALPCLAASRRYHGQAPPRLWTFPGHFRLPGYKLRQILSNIRYLLSCSWLGATRRAWDWSNTDKPPKAAEWLEHGDFILECGDVRYDPSGRCGAKRRYHELGEPKAG